MSLAFACPGCRVSLTFGDNLRGKKVRCKKCGHVFVVEGTAEKDADAGIQKSPSRAQSVPEREEKEMAAPPRKRRSPEPDEEEIPSPSRKRRSAERDDEEIPPPSRKRKREYDDDSIPPLRRTPWGLIVGLGLVGLAVLIVGVTLVVVLMYFRSSGTVLPEVANREKVEGLPANADSTTKALHDLKSPNNVRRKEAAKRLKMMVPNERSGEVARALEASLKAADPFTQKEIVEALGVWGTKDSVPALLDALATDNPFMRWAIFHALTHFPDEHVCEVLAQHLEELGDMKEAAAALKSIGAMAEKAVLKRLRHPQVFVRQEVCQILLVIGTKESLPALKNVVAEGEFFTKDEAQKALQTIQAREKAGK